MADAVRGAYTGDSAPRKKKQKSPYGALIWLLFLGPVALRMFAGGGRRGGRHGGFYVGGGGFSVVAGGAVVVSVAEAAALAAGELRGTGRTEDRRQKTEDRRQKTERAYSQGGKTQGQ